MRICLLNMVFLNEISVIHLGCSLVMTPILDHNPLLRINAFISFIDYFLIHLSMASHTIFKFTERVRYFSANDLLLAPILSCSSEDN